MKQSFDSYLNSCYSQKGEGHTHTRIGDNALSIKGGSYTIPNLNEFYSKYVKHVFQDAKFEFLTEKQHIEKGPILVDFDFRYETSIERKQHSDTHINDMVDLYFQEIKEILNIPANTTIPVFIFEKENVNMLDKITKDGVHMIIGINMDRTLQIILRNRISTKLKDIWSDLPLQNSWDEVLDEGITKGTTNWQLYGSRKPGNECYLLKYHYTLELDGSADWCLNIHDVKKFDLKQNFPLLTAQYKDHAEFEMLDSIRDEYEDTKNSKRSKPKNKLKIVDKNRNFDINEITSRDMLDEAIEHFLDEIETKDYYIKETHQYTMCLTENYYNPYDKWIRVGWALKNTHESLFLTWVAFSAQSEKFEYDKIPEYYEKWRKFDKCNDDGLTFRSIMYWAKNDNHAKYKEVREETIDYFVDKTVENPTDFDFALVLYHMYKDDYTCVSIKKDIWYIYNNHRWEENEGGTGLRMSISKDLFDIYFAKMNKIQQHFKSGTVDSSSEKYDILAKQAKKLGDMSKNLKQRGVKDNIMREAKEIFYDNTFMDKVDANPKLLCFNNGVLDFENKVFRKGKPDDYLSKSTNISYVKLDLIKHKTIIDEINDFMHKLFPEQELRDYMWQHLASTLIGENNDQTFNIYNGNGSNGKSKLVELMAACLGDYKATVPITLITAKRNTIGSTSSEVVQLKGVRYAVMQEPSKGDRLNEGIMKEITGGDPLQGRALFKDSITFIPQFKLVVCTNTLLDVNSNDEGTWRRLCVCEFKSKFCVKEEFDDDREYQFEIDKKLGEKYIQWCPIFMSMLVEKAYITGGLVKICQAVKASSSNYRNTQDYYSEFVSDKVKKCVGGKIKETSLYEVFKVWFQLHHGKNVPKGRDLFEFMNKKFGKKQRGVWANVSIIYDDFDPSLDENEDD
jgi:P4 family phage/plasmid primase-like protien